MAKFSWSEVFISLEGEGPYTGTPTVYVRFTGCNFTCSKFNNPYNLNTSHHSILGFNPKDYSNIYEIPVIEHGCDSQYSWNPEFSHMWITGDENQLAQEIVSKLPNGKWVHPKTGQPVIFSITGGEPMLTSKKLPSLLDHPLMEDCRVILFETNGSVPIHPTCLEYLQNWVSQPREHRYVIFSNSPKLSSSGEPRDKAIRPEIIWPQLSLGPWREGVVEQYFKFVCANETDLNEVEDVMEIYYQNNAVMAGAGVYIMPMACTYQQQDAIAASLADLCIQRGYRFCIRLQNVLWANTVGS